MPPSKHGQKKFSAERTVPLKANGGDDEYFEDVEFSGDDYGFETANTQPPDAYEESVGVTTTVRCCGAFCCVLMGVLSLSWIVHAIPVATISDIPSFARSVIWMSIAHHTDAWRAQQGVVSPPPPMFGDGQGHFIDVYPPPPPGSRL